MALLIIVENTEHNFFQASYAFKKNSYKYYINNPNIINKYGHKCAITRTGRAIKT